MVTFLIMLGVMVLVSVVIGVVVSRPPSPEKTDEPVRYTAAMREHADTVLSIVGRSNRITSRQVVGRVSRATSAKAASVYSPNPPPVDTDNSYNLFTQLLAAQVIATDDPPGVAYHAVPHVEPTNHCTPTYEACSTTSSYVSSSSCDSSSSSYDSSSSCDSGSSDSGSF
jgi:hypothetical protein